MALGDILQALTTATGGIAEGVNQRKKLESQALHQRLADELLKAQIGYTNRRDTKPKPGELGKYKPHVNDDGTVDYIWEPAAGEAPPPPQTPATPGQQPASPGRAPVVHSGQRVKAKPVRPIVSTDAQGNVLAIDPRSLHATQVTGAAKPLNAQERTAGSQEESAGRSIATMEQIAQRNPEAAKAAVAAIQAGGWGKAGKVYAALRGFTSQKDAQTFFTEYKNMLLAVTPTYGGARPTQQLMDLEQQASLPALGAGDFSTAFGHMHNRLNDLRAKSRQPRTDTPASPSAAPSINPRFDPRQKP